MTVPALRLVDEAVLAALRTGTGRPIAAGEFRASDSVAIALASGDVKQMKAAAPWGYLFAIDGGSRSGPMGDPFADAEVAYQVTCVGGDVLQARWLADKVADVVVNATIAPTGMVVIYRNLDAPGGATPEGVMANATVRFFLTVTPA